jgi:hypothetical protein
MRAAPFRLGLVNAWTTCITDTVAIPSSVAPIPVNAAHNSLLRVPSRTVARRYRVVMRIHQHRTKLWVGSMNIDHNVCSLEINLRKVNQYKAAMPFSRRSTYRQPLGTLSGKNSIRLVIIHNLYHALITRLHIPLYNILDTV